MRTIMPDLVRACSELIRHRHSHTRPRFTSPIIALVWLLFASPFTLAQSDALPEPDRLLNLRLDWKTQVARQEVADWLGNVVSAPRSGTSVSNFEDPSIILKELGPALADDYRAAGNSLRTLAEKTKAKKSDVQKEWAEVVRQKAAFRDYAEQQQRVYGFNFDAGTHAGFRPGLIDTLLALWVGLAAVIAWRLRNQEQRLERRHLQRASAMAILLSVALLPGCGSSGTEDNRPWAVREEARLTAALTEATSRAATAETAADAKWQATANAWAKLVTVPKAAGKDDVARVVKEGEREIRDTLQTIAIDARLANDLAKDAAELQSQLTDERAKLDGLISGARLRLQVGAAARMAAATLLFGLTVAPFWFARRARRQRLRLAARTCPRCFRIDTLKREKHGGEDEPTPRYRGGKKSRKKVEEDEEESEEDTRDEVRCVKCALRIRKSYLTVPRLCFPTVGVRSSGKTHMLVTAFDRVRKRTTPTVAIVQPAPSGSDVDRRFDQLVDEVLHRRGVAGATDLSLPDPILIHVRDADRTASSSALVNLFDYSGELINPDVDVNMLKATAVRMDGFMLFLDPTQLYGDGANVTLDQQLAMLDEFLAHMRKERKIPVGEVIPVPVAICVPKFDLLISDNPIGGQSVHYIRELLEHLNPVPRQVTLDVIRKRSDLVEQMLPLLFPGVEIRGVVEGYFGKQVMFFPMSSVSLSEHELGVKELDRRTMAPFGVAEPMMWLLHMHGYEMFA